MTKASLAVIKSQVKEYELCYQNLISSFSLLYAQGVIGKVKYQRSRSALEMRDTGKHANKGSKERLLFGMGVPIPKPLSSGVLMKKMMWGQSKTGHPVVCKI